MIWGGFYSEDDVVALKDFPDWDSKVDPARCKAKNRLGEQCGRTHLPGHYYCDFHWKKFCRRGSRREVPLYRSALQGKLVDVLQQIEEQTADRVDLTEEINVARAVCERAICLFEKACFPKNTETNGKGASETSKLFAMKITQDALTHVAVLVEKHAKVQALSALTPEHLDKYSGDIARILHDALMPENAALYGDIIQRIENIELGPRDGLTVQIT